MKLPENHRFVSIYSQVYAKTMTCIGDYDAAMNSFEKSHRYFLQAGNIYKVVAIELEIGTIFIATNEYQKCVWKMENQIEKHGYSV